MMKTRARALLEELNLAPEWADLWQAVVEIHLAAAYEQGRADEKVAQNPPGVAQPWTPAVEFSDATIESWRAVFEPDPRLKAMTEDEVAQLGRALACTRARGDR